MCASLIQVLENVKEVGHYSLITILSTDVVRLTVDVD